jgi:hypothetical protein
MTQERNVPSMLDIKYMGKCYSLGDKILPWIEMTHCDKPYKFFRRNVSFLGDTYIICPLATLSRDVTENVTADGLLDGHSVWVRLSRVGPWVERSLGHR